MKRLAGLRRVERSSGSSCGAPSLPTRLRRANPGARCERRRCLRRGLGRSGRRCMWGEARSWTNDGRFAALLRAWFAREGKLARARDEELDEMVAQGIVVGELVQLGARALPG